MRKKTILILFSAALMAVLRADASETSDSVREAIRSSEDRFAQAEMRRDVDAMMEMYADDVVLLPPGEAPVMGKAAASAWMNRLRQSKVQITNERFETLELEVCGDLAFERGQVVADEQVPGKPARTSRTKYLSLWRRQGDGSWKVSRDIWDPIEEHEVSAAAAVEAAPVKVAAAPPPPQVNSRIPLPDPQGLSEGMIRTIQDKLHSQANKIRALPKADPGNPVVVKAVSYLEGIIRKD